MRKRETMQYLYVVRPLCSPGVLNIALVIRNPLLCDVGLQPLALCVVFLLLVTLLWMWTPTKRFWPVFIFRCSDMTSAWRLFFFSLLMWCTATEQNSTATDLRPVLEITRHVNWWIAAVSLRGCELLMIARPRRLKTANCLDRHVRRQIIFIKRCTATVTSTLQMAWRRIVGQDGLWRMVATVRGLSLRDQTFVVSGSFSTWLFAAAVVCKDVNLQDTCGYCLWSSLQYRLFLN